MLVIIKRISILPSHGTLDQLCNDLFKLNNDEFSTIFTAKSLNVTDRLTFSDWVSEGHFQKSNLAI